VQRLLGDRMGRDVFFYSITIDPTHDTPAVLKAYAEQFGAGPGWLTIQRALADDSLAGVEARAHDIAVEAAKGGPAEQKVMAAAKRFERVTDLSSARLAFGRLSDAMLISAKRTRGSLDPRVKVAYCPMARKYWLQTSATIENPYYGATMRTCGRFEAEIPSLE
jgi:SCO1/SenC family protein